MTMDNKTISIISRFERLIKVLIFYCAMHLLDKNALMLKLTALISQLDKELPKELIDREKYINGAKASAIKMINKCYVPITYNFPMVQSQVITKPLDIWSVQKASPNVGNYYEKVRKALTGLNRTELTTSEAGKKPISLWQKTELDIRHNAQMEMVQDAYDTGEDLFWLSSHPDCSERCEKWQGKLVSLHKRAKHKDLWTGETIDGNKVYSFIDIENQVDKYGYQNNIINGFNCRHYLIAYKNQKVAPREYNWEVVKKERQIESNIREMERAIRRKKIDYEVIKDYDKMKAKSLKDKIAVLTGQYKAYCEKKGFAWSPERIRV